MTLNVTFFPELPQPDFPSKHQSLSISLQQGCGSGFEIVRIWQPLIFLSPYLRKFDLISKPNKFVNVYSKKVKKKRDLVKIYRDKHQETGSRSQPIKNGSGSASRLSRLQWTGGYTGEIRKMTIFSCKNKNTINESQKNYTWVK